MLLQNTVQSLFQYLQKTGNLRGKHLALMKKTDCGDETLAGLFCVHRMYLEKQNSMGKINGKG